MSKKPERTLYDICLAAARDVDFNCTSFGEGISVEEAARIIEEHFERFLDELAESGEGVIIRSSQDVG